MFRASLRCTGRCTGHGNQARLATLDPQRSHQTSFRGLWSVEACAVVPWLAMSEPSIEMYIVVVNHEEQYSVWPSYREVPVGWKATGTSGTKDECLAHISEVWTDMRPLSLRQDRDGGSTT